jgi:hypothetical protein
VDQDRVRIAYLLLAHEPPAAVAERVREILAYDPDGTVVVHYDAAAPAAAFEALRAAVGDGPRVRLLSERVASGWGQFGLAEAALNGLRRLRADGAALDAVHLLSVSCAPIRSIGSFKAHLAAHRDTDFIESEGPEWIIGGLREERWTLHHPFNERKYRWWFNRAVELQRLLGVKRRPPDGIEVRFGSQWWTLSWSTCAALLAYLDERPEVVRFFRTVWIPDECFFQSLVPHVRPEAARPGHNLTFYQFTNQGKPVVFHDDHADLLARLPFFFARKISPRAERLRARLLERAREEAPAPGGVGRKTAAYAATMIAQSAYPTPGQAFYGSQVADAHGPLLATAGAPYVAIWSGSWWVDRLAERLPAEVPVQRLPAAAGADAATRVLAELAPAQLIARHARRAAGEGVVLLTPEVPLACLEAVAADPRGRLVCALPAVEDVERLELIFRLAAIAADPELRAHLHDDPALHDLPLPAVVQALTEHRFPPGTVAGMLALGDEAAATALPAPVQQTLQAVRGGDVTAELVEVLPPGLAEAAREVLDFAPPPPVAKLAG